MVLSENWGEQTPLSLNDGWGWSPCSLFHWPEMWGSPHFQIYPHHPDYILLKLHWSHECGNFAKKKAAPRHHRCRIPWALQMGRRALPHEAGHWVGWCAHAIRWCSNVLITRGYIDVGRLQDPCHVRISCIMIFTLSRYNIPYKVYHYVGVPKKI